MDQPNPANIAEVRRRMADGEPLHEIEDDLDLRENQQDKGASGQAPSLKSGGLEK